MLRAALFFGAVCAAAALSFGLTGQQASGNDYFRQPFAGHGVIPGYTPVVQAPTVLLTRDPLAILGQKLFYDGRLSGSGRTACASCHNPNFGFSDPRPVSISDNGQRGRRNAPSLWDVGFLPKLMWDGRFQSLEEQAFGPFQSGEMGARIEHAAQRVSTDPHYVQHFQAVGLAPSPDGIVRALASFQRTLVSQPSRIDRYVASRDPGILSSLERDGYAIFTGTRGGCANCHRPVSVNAGNGYYGPSLYTDFQFHNLGVGYRPGAVPDAGLFERTRNPADVGLFRTPSLRNSAKSPPYMHDGSLPTLEEVVEFYSAGGQPNPNISPQIRPRSFDGYEKAALVAFLRALGE